MDVDVAIRGAMKTDAKVIGENMRSIDALEVRCCSGRSPVNALREAIAYGDTHTYTVDKDGEPIAMFGAHDISLSMLGMKVASVWFLGTPAVEQLPAAWVRHSRAYVIRMQADFDLLMNYVHEANKTSIRWLKWCGFVIDTDSPRTFAGQIFIPFFRGR